MPQWSNGIQDSRVQTKLERGAVTMADGQTNDHFAANFRESNSPDASIDAREIKRALCIDNDLATKANRVTSE